LNWLFEIFSENSDQARLISILISALVAVMIVLLNQWFLARRAKREILILKIEELFSESSCYIKVCTDMLNFVSDNWSPSNSEVKLELPLDLMHEITDSINKIDMICCLYFRSHKFKPEEYLFSNMPILEIARGRQKATEDQSLSAHKTSIEHVENSRIKLDALCKDLMNKYGH